MNFLTSNARRKQCQQESIPGERGEYQGRLSNRSSRSTGIEDNHDESAAKKAIMVNNLINAELAELRARKSKYGLRPVHSSMSVQYLKQQQLSRSPSMSRSSSGTSRTMSTRTDSWGSSLLSGELNSITNKGQQHGVFLNSSGSPTSNMQHEKCSCRNLTSSIRQHNEDWDFDDEFSIITRANGITNKR